MIVVAGPAAIRGLSGIPATYYSQSYLVGWTGSAWQELLGYGNGGPIEGMVAEGTNLYLMGRRLRYIGSVGKQMYRVSFPDLTVYSSQAANVRWASAGDLGTDPETGDGSEIPSMQFPLSSGGAWQLGYNASRDRIYIPASFEARCQIDGTVYQAPFVYSKSLGRMVPFITGNVAPFDHSGTLSAGVGIHCAAYTAYDANRLIIGGTFRGVGTTLPNPPWETTATNIVIYDEGLNQFFQLALGAGSSGLVGTTTSGTSSTSGHHSHSVTGVINIAHNTNTIIAVGDFVKPAKEGVGFPDWMGFAVYGIATDSFFAQTSDGITYGFRRLLDDDATFGRGKGRCVVAHPDDSHKVLLGGWMDRLSGITCQGVGAFDVGTNTFSQIGGVGIPRGTVSLRTPDVWGFAWDADYLYAVGNKKISGAAEPFPWKNFVGEYEKVWRLPRPVGSGGTWEAIGISNVPMPVLSAVAMDFTIQEDEPRV